MGAKLYKQQAEYLVGIARLHGAVLADYMDAYAEHVILAGYYMEFWHNHTQYELVPAGWDGNWIEEDSHE